MWNTFDDLCLRYNILMMLRSICLWWTEMCGRVSWTGRILIADLDRRPFCLSSTQSDVSFGEIRSRNIVEVYGMILKLMMNDGWLCVIRLSIKRTWVSRGRNESNLRFGTSRWWGLCSNGWLIVVSWRRLVIYMRINVRNHVSRAGWAWA